MRNLYLVRHGRVEFPGGIRRCIGRTDLKLDEVGRRQARALAEYFLGRDIQVFCSPLARARETARILARDRVPVQVRDGLVELDMGEWESLPMAGIKKSLESEPVLGEGRENGLRRFRGAVNEILDSTDGDIVCVAHAGVNSCFLADLLGSPISTSRALPQPYGCFSRIEIHENGGKSVAELGRMTETAPDGAECEVILEHYHTPEHVREHCRQVCRQALRLGERMRAAGYDIDLRLVQSAALLHDVARTEPDHAVRGAEWILREGYPQVADIVLRHHDLGNVQSHPYETTLVYLADKLVQGDRVVNLEERFERSRNRCSGFEHPEEALKAHERRYSEARAAMGRVQEWIGAELPGGLVG